MSFCHFAHKKYIILIYLILTRSSYVPNTHEAELYLTLVPEEVSSGQTMNEK
jgi:hypothetical protein